MRHLCNDATLNGVIWPMPKAPPPLVTRTTPSCSRANTWMLGIVMPVSLFR